MNPPAPSTDTLASLYHSGAYLCLAIILIYFAAKWASNHIAWLEAPGRAHYVTAGLGALALWVVPATQGTTPNANMIMAAVGTLIALLLPGAPASSSKTTGGGFARISLLAVIALTAAIASCAFFTAEKKAVVSDIVDCTKAEASKAITQFGPVVDALLVYATGGNGMVNTDAIKDAAKNFGKDVGGCVLADAVARALKPAATGSDAPKSSPLTSDPDSLRRVLATVQPGVKFHTANGDL